MGKVIAVDIDGVLTLETEGHDYKVRTPNKDNIQKVNSLYDDGFIITLFTSRFNCDEFDTVQWLEKYNVKYHEIIFDKLQYDYIIDDKSISFSELLELCNRGKI